MKKLALFVLLSGTAVRLRRWPRDETVRFRTQPQEEVALLEVSAPPALEVPEPGQVKGEDDWEARAHNKNIESSGSSTSSTRSRPISRKDSNSTATAFSPTLHEEWEDTQVQLTTGDHCTSRARSGWRPEVRQTALPRPRAGVAAPRKTGCRRRSHQEHGRHRAAKLKG